MSRNKIITYPYGNPTKKIPEAVRQEVEKRGYIFIGGKELSLGFGAKVTLLSGQVDGYYCENPPAEDGLVGLHYAMAHNWEINNHLESKEPQKGLHGMVYPGFYFILRR